MKGNIQLKKRQAATSAITYAQQGRGTVPIIPYCISEPAKNTVRQGRLRPGRSWGSRPISHPLGHAEQGGIRFGKRFRNSSLTYSSQIADPARTLPTELGGIECANQLEKIIPAVGEPTDRAVMIENGFYRAVPSNDQWLEGSDCVTDRAAPGEVISPAVQRQAHEIDLFQCRQIFLPQQRRFGWLSRQSAGIEVVGLRG